MRARVCQPNRGSPENVYSAGSPIAGVVPPLYNGQILPAPRRGIFQEFRGPKGMPPFAGGAIWGAYWGVGTAVPGPVSGPGRNHRILAPARNHRIL